MENRKLQSISAEICRGTAYGRAGEGGVLTIAYTDTILQEARKAELLSDPSQRSNHAQADACGATRIPGAEGRRDWGFCGGLRREV